MKVYMNIHDYNNLFICDGKSVILCDCIHIKSGFIDRFKFYTQFIFLVK